MVHDFSPWASLATEAAKETKLDTKVACGMRVMPELQNTRIVYRKYVIPHLTMNNRYRMSVLVTALCNQPSRKLALQTSVTIVALLVIKCTEELL